MIGSSSILPVVPTKPQCSVVSSLLLFLCVSICVLFFLFHLCFLCGKKVYKVYIQFGAIQFICIALNNRHGHKPITYVLHTYINFSYSVLNAIQCNSICIHKCIYPTRSKPVVIMARDAFIKVLGGFTDECLWSFSRNLMSTATQCHLYSA